MRPLYLYKTKYRHSHWIQPKMPLIVLCVSQSTPLLPLISLISKLARIGHTGVPQGPKLSPTLFSFYIADTPRPTKPINKYAIFFSSEQLSSDPHAKVKPHSPLQTQRKPHPRVNVADSTLHMERSPKILALPSI